MTSVSGFQWVESPPTPLTTHLQAVELPRDPSFSAPKPVAPSVDLRDAIGLASEGGGAWEQVKGTGEVGENMLHSGKTNRTGWNKCQPGLKMYGPC